MKLSLFATALLGLAPALVLPTQAAIVVPGANGTDGALNITEDTVVDLSKATTGTWNQNNSANAGNGVYDPDKWAVVFKYTSVNVVAGKKLTFKNHATRAPVVWLVSGNVTIAGTVDLSGESSGPRFHPVENPLGGKVCEPGPGGFRGGSGFRGGNILEAAGMGPGGGRERGDNGVGASGGGYGDDGRATEWWFEGGKKYGNPSLIPLIGGSGGGGMRQDDWGYPGGGGGGAILIACSGKVSFINGSQLIALGGNGGGAGGSGGGLRLVCHELVGEGNVSAAGGSGAWAATGGSGRIRLERVVNTAVLNINPAPSTIDLVSGATALIWPPENSPEARIVAVNGITPAADPKASFGAYSPDVALPLVSGVNVIVETLNVEKAASVIVRATPRNGMRVGTDKVSNAAEVNATIKEVVSETPLKLRWEATVPTLPGYSALQARIVRP